MIMSTHDTDTAVLNALKDSLDGVTMHTPVTQIEAAGRARHRRRTVARTATGVAAVTALALGVPALTHPSTAPPQAGISTQAGSVHIRTVAFALDSHTDGTIHVTWDKAKYFSDHQGLQQALRAAGFPVLIKEGVFCAGPQDDTSLNPHGQGPGLDQVVKGERNSDGSVGLVFTPSAVPAGKELFIGFLSPAQLAVTGGRPGSVERLVTIGAELTCTTQAPPPGPQKDGAQPDGGQQPHGVKPDDRAAHSG